MVTDDVCHAVAARCRDLGMCVVGTGERVRRRGGRDMVRVVLFRPYPTGAGGHKATVVLWSPLAPGFLTMVDASEEGQRVIRGEVCPPVRHPAPVTGFGVEEVTPGAWLASVPQANGGGAACLMTTDEVVDACKSWGWEAEPPPGQHALGRVRFGWLHFNCTRSEFLAVAEYLAGLVEGR